MTFGTTAAGALDVDVRALIEGRLLVQASSGGGKSYVLRRLLEVTHGQVQHLVLDVEGDFVTLREKYPYVLAGTGGEAAAHPSSAGTLARKLLELRASAIIDLSDLHVSVREEFVRLFIEELMDAPRELWAPALVVIDEAQMFAPQSQGSSSIDAVRDLAVRGRKRGLAAVLATQRLSSLDKGVADTGNVLIGRTGLDVDQRRAAGVLGLTNAQQRQQLALLRPGTFYAYGPAFGTSSPVLVTIAPVETRHPQLGEKAYDPPPAPEGIREMLAELATVQAEAEEEAHTVEQLRAEVARLRSQASVQKAPIISPPCDHEPLITQLRVDLAKAEADYNRLSLENDLIRDETADLYARIERAQEALGWPEGIEKESTDASPTRTESPGRDGRDGAAGGGDGQSVPGPARRHEAPHGAADEGDAGAPAGLARLPAQPGPGPVGQDGRGAAPSRGQRTPAPAQRLRVSRRDTEDMKDEEVEALIDRKLEARGMILRVEVPAAEVIHHDYQRRAVERIMAKVEELGAAEREAYRYLLSRDVFVSVGEMSEVISGYKGGAAQVKWGSATKKLLELGIVVKGGSGNTGFKTNLRDWIGKQLAVHQPSDTEEEEVYQAVLGRVAGGGS